MKQSESRKNWIEIQSRVLQVGDCRFFGKEFDALIENPKIEEITVTVTDKVGTIAVITKPIFVQIPPTDLKKMGFDQEKLYLGRYGMHIAVRPSIVIENGGMQRISWRNCSVEPAISCMESGRHDGDRKVSYYVAGKYGFCFGSGRRGIFIEQLVRDRELFALITLILDSFWHINPGDIANFRSVFRRLKSGGVLEPPCPKLPSTLLPLPFRMVEEQCQPQAEEEQPDDGR